MLEFLDAIGVGGKYRYVALAAAGLLTVGVFVFTHASPNADASDETAAPCSDPTVTKTVTDIVRKKIFSGESAAMFDESRFGGLYENVVTEDEKPLTCTADFRPMLVYSKLFLAETKANTKGEPTAEKELADKLATRVTYTVKPTDAGGVYVEVTDGLDAFD